MTRKKLAAIIACVVLSAAVGVTSVLVYMRGNGAQETLKENQRYAYMYVNSIQGNEITYTELEESVITAYLAQQESETEEKEGAEPRAQEGAGNPEKEETADRSRNSGEENPPEEMRGQQDGQSSDSFGDGQASDESWESNQEKPTGKGGGITNTEQVTALIPVGVTVHTASDTETTFQRLATGDILKIQMETNEEGEEVMVEIWML